MLHRHWSCCTVECRRTPTFIQAPETFGRAALGLIDPTLTVARQHFLNFFPLPQGHGSFRPTPLKGFSRRWLRALSASACRRHRSWSSRYCSLKQYHPDSSSTVSPNSVESRSSGKPWFTRVLDPPCEILLEMLEPKDVAVNEAAVERFL